MRSTGHQNQRIAINEAQQPKALGRVGCEASGEESNLIRSLTLAGSFASSVQVLKV
jgi:hypothetical protein